MNPEELKKRTLAFGIGITKLVSGLPEKGPRDVLARQLLRCGTSVGANYRAACRAKSHADFIAKLKIVEEECDESLYWMELLRDAGICENALLSNLMNEASQLLSITVASIRTERSSNRHP